MNDKNDIWKDEQLRQLADVLASISDPNEIRAFLRDVMTQKEIIEVGARLQAAKMLSKGETKNTLTSLQRRSSVAVRLLGLATGCKTVLAAIKTSLSIIRTFGQLALSSL